MSSPTSWSSFAPIPCDWTVWSPRPRAAPCSSGEVSIVEGKEAIRDLIQDTAYLLNHEQFVDYMNTFADTSTYEMLVRSREIGGKLNVCLRLNKPDMMQLLSEVKNHVRDEGSVFTCSLPYILM